MVPTYTTIERQTVFLLVVEVQARHLHGVQTLTATAETTATTTAGEAHIVDVVGTGHQEDGHVILHHATEQTTGIAMLGTHTHVGIDHRTTVHTWLHTKVEHRLFFTVFDTADTRQVTLLIIGLNLVDNAGRQVLHSGLGVAGHELLTVDKDLLHLLTVNLDGTVVAHLRTGQTSHQFLYHRTFGRTESAGIINEGIGLHRHLGGTGSHRGSFQHDSIRSQRDGTCRDILVVGYLNCFRVSLETYIGHFQRVTTVRGGLDAKGSIHIRHSVGYDLIITQKGCSGLNNGLLCVFFDNFTRHGPLRKCGNCRQTDDDQKE